MLEFRVATDPGSPDKPNEDAFAILPTLAVVADGATSPPHLGDGCIHGPAWYAQTLVGFVAAAHLSRPAAEPADLLAEAIERTTQAHSGSCDVGHPGSPSATVAMVTMSPDGILRWLVLGDCTFVADAGPDLLVVSDDRLSNTSHAERAAVKEPGAASDPVEYARRIDALVLAQRAHRNRPGGFWVASTDPQAGCESLAGSVAADTVGRRGALFTDGASRIVDLYGIHSWSTALKVLDSAGSSELLRQLRIAETRDQVANSFPRVKVRDDATALAGHWGKDV
ncbi:protein phosphatase 2C domain-containing protein [Nakamurella sp.]|uniref:protein phosphatase 2C domain-containing protein n=1 Tax=Nakamurella sp. TaxID=1869182 RepID=UPI003B3B3686